MQNSLKFISRVCSGNIDSFKYVNRIAEFAGRTYELINGYNDDEFRELIQYLSNFGIDIESEIRSSGYEYGDTPILFNLYLMVYIFIKTTRRELEILSQIRNNGVDKYLKIYSSEDAIVTIPRNNIKQYI